MIFALFDVIERSFLFCMSTPLQYSKRATLKDVAQSAGVAKSTASAALSGKGRMSDATRSAIVQIARDLGYYAHPLAQDLSRGGRHDTISIFSAGLDTGVVTQTILKIQMALYRKGFLVPLHVTSHVSASDADVQAKAVATVCHERPYAIVCNTDNLHEAALDVLRNHIQGGGAVIAYGFERCLPCDSILVDLEHATFQATMHLLELGHRDIALCWTSPLEKNHPWSRGFRKAFRQFGVAVPDVPAPWSYEETYPVASEEGSGQRMAENFLALRRRPSGLVVINDKIASVLAQTLLKQEVRVPQDVSIVGHDNLPVSAHGTIRLTTVSYPADEIASSVAALLPERTTHTGKSRLLRVRGHLFERDSSAPLHRSRQGR
jgi:DNA-binding LacI/PurR family transcriptional regulator